MRRRLRCYKLHIAVGFLSFLLLSSAVYHTKQREYDNVIRNELTDEIVVLLEDGMSSGELETFVSSVSKGIEVRRHLDDYALLYVPDSKEYDQVLKDLNENPLVKTAQTNHSIGAFRSSNDTFSDAQWSVHNPGRFFQYIGGTKRERLSTEGVDMDVVKAWQTLNKDNNSLREVVVAIIDTGVDYEHPELAPNMWMNPGEIPGDGIDNDGNGYVDDIYGWDFYNSDNTVCHYQYDPISKTNIAATDDNDDHGTHIAGIIAATANNNIGIAGIASNVNVKIMTLKINGGPNATGSIGSAIEAIKYATMMGADICNLSWGTFNYNEALEIVMRESNMLFIAAAGNSGTNNNSKPVYPASYQLDNLISVTYITPHGKLANFSNYGTTSVDVAAPGEDIFSTAVGIYAYMSGSSMAAPHVSAVAAMLYSYDYNLYPSNIKEILLSNVKAITGLEGYMRHPGIISAYNAVVSSDSLMKDTSAPVLTYDAKVMKGEINVAIYPEDKGGSKIRTVKWLEGKKDIASFNRGVTGTRVVGNRVNFTKSGIYTLYASDYAGNETVLPIEVSTDITAPKITATYTISSNLKTRTVSVQVTDEESGVSQVRYMVGRKKVSDFRKAGAGTELKLNKNKASFKVEKDGVYTIYAIDNRGNPRIFHLNVVVIRMKDMKFLRRQTVMTIGEQYSTVIIPNPTNTTDRVTYSSSNKSIASVDSKGKVTAHREGTVIITAKSNNGVKTICEIKIKKP